MAAFIRICYYLRVKTYLLTGGTGFLGSYLSKKLLAEGNTIIFLGRSKNGVSLENRISKNIGDYIPGRIKYIEADISSDPEELLKSVIPIGNIDGIWHLAADLSFKTENKERVFKTNIGGAKSMLAVARHFKCRLYYMSTAYVHGRSSGLEFEKIGERPAIFNNPYEESKYDAELLVQNTADVDAVIFRLSILIDHNVERISNFGYYSFVQSLIYLRKSMNLSDKKNILLPIPVIYCSNSLLNLMPIDIAVRLMLEISKSQKSSRKIFHITNPKPFFVGDILKQTFQALAIKIPVIGVPRFLALPYLSLFIFCGSCIKPLRSVARKIKYFKWYMLKHASYDQSNVKSVIGVDTDTYFDFSDSYIYELVNSFKKRFEIDSKVTTNL